MSDRHRHRLIARHHLLAIPPSAVVKVIFLTTTGAGTWTVPSDWSNTNKIETIGAGGGATSSASSGGGGGGAYSSISNITSLTASQVVNLNVGAGGNAGSAGTDTWFGATTLAASIVGAKGGGAASAQTGGGGGASASGFPTSGGVRNSGGAGGNGNTTGVTGGGGGGAAGPGGIGGTGGAGDTSATGADFGGSGGGSGGNTGAGGNGGAGSTSAGAAGTAGAGGGQTGGLGGSGAGVAPTGGGSMWTSTHAADGTTTSVANAGTGAGSGGSGSATGAPASGGLYGGGGGGGGTTAASGASGRNGLIVITYTASTVAPVTPTTWDPAKQGTGVALTNGNLTLERTSSGSTYSRSGTVDSKSTGKYYCEFKVDMYSTGNFGIGWMNASADFTTSSGATYVGNAADGVGWYPAQNAIYHNAALLGSMTYTLNVGDIVGLAWDAGAKLIWYRVNNGLWNNFGPSDPATGTSGFNPSGMTGAMVPAVCSYVIGDKVTANFGATAFAFTPPSGFGILGA